MKVQRGYKTELRLNDKQRTACLRKGEYSVFEGVIAKGGEKHDLWMYKIKTNDYLDRVRKIFKTDWQQYGE